MNGFICSQEKRGLRPAPIFEFRQKFVSELETKTGLNPLTNVLHKNYLRYHKDGHLVLL